MDFFEHQERARRQTNLFVLYFIVAVVAVALSVYLAAMAIIALVRMQQEPGEPLQFWNPEIFIAACGSTLLIISFGSLYKIWALGSSGESVALSLGGRKVPGNTRDLGERVLLNVVEEMALASGTPVPPVYIMDAESAINAFAAGTTPQNAVIGITRGAIDALNRDELQGVIAHEFSHILNGDMRLNLRLMGWLHGILVIAMIGYMIVRAFGSFGSRSSSSSGDKKNGGGGEYAILLGGLALVVIGYAGVFFAQLIKAAVSRQREFLADASAVEFTRNPSGIANALKRIGGWQNQSRMRSVQAEESSHMFFGNAFTSSLFATHPPLLERVRRIEPDFSGPFAAARPIEHSLDEIIDPRSLALARDGGAAVHQAALVGAERLSQQPAELVQTVGQPREEHIEHVHGLVDNLDEPLSGDVRDPLGAVATIYALLLAPVDSALRSQQLGILRAQADPGILFEFDRILASVDALSEEQRLPVASLAFPALHQMSLPQVLDFHNLVQVLVRMDNQISLFEFAIQRYITKRLLPRLERKKVQRSSHKSLEQLSGPITVVLSTLAYAGDRSNPEHAFDQGRAGLGPAMLNASLQPREQCSVKQLDQALDDISTVELSSRKALLAAFTQCIAADGHMSIREAELLRVIADTLGCPVPPVL